MNVAALIVRVAWAVAIVCLLATVVIGLLGRAASELHGASAHFFTVLLPFAIPLLIIAPFLRGRPAWRSILLALTAASAGAFVMLANFSAYIRPEGPTPEAAALLRYVLLHKILTPIGAGALFAILAWRLRVRR